MNALFCQTLIPFSLSCFDKGCYNARFVMRGPINLSEFFKPLIKKDVNRETWGERINEF